MEKEKLYKKACDDYNSERFSLCAKKLNKLYKNNGMFDPALTSFCCYKIMESNIDDGSLDKCLKILKKEKSKLNESQLKILKIVEDYKNPNNTNLKIDDYKKLQKFKIVNAYYDKS